MEPAFFLNVVFFSCFKISCLFLNCQIWRSIYISFMVAFMRSWKDTRKLVLHMWGYAEWNKYILWTVLQHYKFRILRRLREGAINTWKAQNIEDRVSVNSPWEDFFAATRLLDAPSPPNHCSSNNRAS